MLNFHQSLSFLNWLFPLLHFPQEFPARFSCNNFPQDFPELDPDWLAPHHPIPNAKFPPVTAFLKLAFSPPPFPTRISCKIFLQQFPARFSCNNFLQEFPARFSTRFSPARISHNIFPCNNFLQQFPTVISRKIFLQEFPTTFSCKNFPQDFPTTISRKNFAQHFPARFSTRFSHSNFLQDFPSTISHNNFPQDFPELDTDWLAPHHPIPNAKFPPITVFLKLDFPLLHFLQEFPARFSPNNFPHDFPARFPTTISRKIFLSWILIGWLPITLFQMLNFHQSLSFLNWLFPLLHFPQEFPARFSPNNFPQDFPELDPDWLAPHHPIPNAKFPPVTAFLKLAFSPPPFPARISCKIFLQQFPARFSCNNFLQQFPARFSHKIFPQQFPARFSWARSWLVVSPSPYSKW